MTHYIACRGCSARIRLVKSSAENMTGWHDSWIAYDDDELGLEHRCNKKSRGGIPKGWNSDEEISLGSPQDPDRAKENKDE